MAQPGKFKLPKNVNIKSIRPSQIALKSQVEKLGQKHDFAEKAAWTLWGLTSTWNPYWAQNQQILLQLIEDQEADVIDQLLNLLKRKDDTLKLKALGALAQIPYIERRIKKHMVEKPMLLDRLCKFLSSDIALADSFHAQQLQMRSARVLASMSSTPFADYTILQTMALHPGLLSTLLEAANGGARPATRHEVVRILYNLSFSPEQRVLDMLRRCGCMERLLLPVLEGKETGPCVALRSLWAIVTMANLLPSADQQLESLDSRDMVGDGKQPQRVSTTATVMHGQWDTDRVSGAVWAVDKVSNGFFPGNEPPQLEQNEVKVLVAAFDASIHDENLDDLDPELHGTFGCVDIYEAQDATLRIYPFTMLVPLLRLSRISNQRQVMIEHGICQLVSNFLRKFVRMRKQDYNKALRKAEAARKVAMASGEPGDHPPPPLPPKTQKIGDGFVEHDFGLPPLDSEEDLQHSRSLLECLHLICSLSACPEGAVGLHASGTVPAVSAIVINRHSFVREQVCKTIEIVSSSATAAGVTGSPREETGRGLRDAGRQREDIGSVDAVNQSGDGEMEFGSASEVLAGALFDSEHNVRLTAGRALGRVYLPTHQLAAKRCLKALASNDANIRRCAVGALGSIHREGHRRYWTSPSTLNAGRRRKDEGTKAEGEEGDGGLMSVVLNRLFHKSRGVRLSAACSLLEMCALGEEEEALSPHVRSKRQRICDSCCWGAEGVTDELLNRLQKYVDEGSGFDSHAVSPLISPIRSPVGRTNRTEGMAGARYPGKNRRRQGGGDGGSVAVSPSERSIASSKTSGAADSRRSRGSTAASQEASERNKEDDALQIEGVRLQLYILGHVCPLSRRLKALAILYNLLTRHELTASIDEAKLPPISFDLCSNIVRPMTRSATRCPLASFQALVSIATVWSEGTEDDEREFSHDFREQFVDFSGRDECLWNVRANVQHDSALVRQSAAIALGELSKGTDTESLDVLINLKFDPDPDVVQSVVQSIAQIVVGKKLEDGTLASFVGVSPAKNTKRLPSATRRLHPLPPRPLVTREWMDKVKDVDGDGWHAYVYWSQCVRGVAGKPPCARAMKYIMDVKDAVDALGIPGWIYTLKSLEQDLVETNDKEMKKLKADMEHKTQTELDELHDKLLWMKEQTTVKKRMEQDKEMRAKERDRPWFTFDDDDDPREQSFFAEKLTELELEEKKKKREAAVASRLQAMAAFDLEVENLAIKHTAELKKLVHELEDYMEMQLKSLREDNDELLDKRRSKLIALQERRSQEAAAGNYGDLVWDVVLQRLEESEIFVACLTPQYFSDPVCRLELAKASAMGKTIVPVLFGPMPGMYNNPENSAGVALSGGGIWWPPRDEMGQYLDGCMPIDMFQAVGPSVEESESFRSLFQRLSSAVSQDIAKYQAESDVEYGSKHQEAVLRQRLFTQSRISSRAEWMLKGKNG